MVYLLIGIIAGGLIGLCGVILGAAIVQSARDKVR